VIVASVPVRICDIGGWTDTWFGGPGRVLNIAVAPGIEVEFHECDGGGVRPKSNPIVDAAIETLPPPDGGDVEIVIRSAVPAGSGTGTSAAVAVALLGGLSALRAESRSPREIAYAAHRLEVDVLGGESGIQDQLSTALGGINYLEIDHYPEATVQRLPAWDDLEAGLTLVSLGRPHDSSTIHKLVIGRIQGGGSTAALDRLRAAARAARDAVHERDVRAFGRAMVENTDGQSALHPDLVGSDARDVIDVARASGAVGWKVNGAGGEGGSVTIMHDNQEAKARFEQRVGGYPVLPVRIASEGLVIERSDNPR
jgi:D-glycero-alpha-D-manno-heptose-7-phosphate kinase